MKPIVYVAPSATRKEGYPNPYFKRLKKNLESSCKVLESDNKACLMQGLALLRNSFKADVFLLSFVEGLAFQKLAPVQTFLAILSLGIIRIRKRTMVFFFHNPVAHKGNNWMSRLLFKKLFSHADYVVAHSANTAEIARSKVGKDRVLLFSHPTEPLKVSEPAREDTDVLIWGTVFPYKGVLEFVSNPQIRESGLRITILGACPDPILAQRIHSCTNDKIEFDERRASLDEIASRVAGCRFVLFPYHPESISGSASLMDTLKMGGSPVGPDAGAFHDLAEEGLCKTYQSEDELLSILRSGWSIDQNKLAQFLENHSWPAFVEALSRFIPSLRQKSYGTDNRR